MYTCSRQISNCQSYGRGGGGGGGAAGASQLRNSEPGRGAGQPDSRAITKSGEARASRLSSPLASVCVSVWPSPATKLVRRRRLKRGKCNVSSPRD